MTYAWLIEPGKFPEPLDWAPPADFLAQASTKLQAGVDICSCWADGKIVMAVDEWGLLNGLPINPTAWFLYGRSPLVGSVIAWHDDREPIPEFGAWVRSIFHHDHVYLMNKALSEDYGEMIDFVTYPEVDG